MPCHPIGSAGDTQRDAPRFQLASAHRQGRVTRDTHRGRQDYSLAQANPHRKLFAPQLFMKAWLCSYECHCHLHPHTLFTSFWQHVGITSELTFCACIFLASCSTSLFARTFIVIRSQVREPARPLCSRAVCFGPEVTELFALPTIGCIKLCCNTVKHATSGFSFSFCPQFLSSVLPYLSQRASRHLARFEISFKSLAFAVYEEILLLPRVVHRKVIFAVILGFVSSVDTQPS